MNQGKGGYNFCSPYYTSTPPNLQPPKQPCTRCLAKDHYHNQCPFKKNICGHCSKVGHKDDACKDLHPQDPCRRCGKTNHVADQCHFKDKECNGCGKEGHAVAMCPLNLKDKNSAVDPAVHSGPSKEFTWPCLNCRHFNAAKDKRCRGLGGKCNKAREDVPLFQPQQPKMPAQIIGAWQDGPPPDGQREASSEEQTL